MRVIIFIFIFTTINAAYADVKVLYDKNTGEVENITEKGEFIIAEEDKSRLSEGVVKSDIKSLNLNRPIDEYIFRNGAIIINNDKVSERESLRQNREERQKEIESIEKRVKLNALEELKSEGKSFKHIKESDFE